MAKKVKTPKIDPSIFRKGPGTVLPLDKPCVEPAIPGLHPENDELIDKLHKKVMKQLEKEGKVKNAKKAEKTKKTKK